MYEHDQMQRITSPQRMLEGDEAWGEGLEIEEEGMGGVFSDEEVLLASLAVMCVLGEGMLLAPLPFSTPWCLG